MNAKRITEINDEIATLVTALKGAQARIIELESEVQALNDYIKNTEGLPR